MLEPNRCIEGVVLYIQRVQLNSLNVHTSQKFVNIAQHLIQTLLLHGLVMERDFNNKL